jgi:acylphosphatase
MKKRAHAIYHGRVQGVGFRFTCQRIAADNNITGWVKNLHDGGVQVIAEGDQADLKKFFNELKDSMARYVSSDNIQWLDFQKEFKGFNIRF